MPRNLRWQSSVATFYCILTLAPLLCGSIVQASANPATLVSRIDALVAEGNVVPVAGGIDDLTFLRRVYLDLTGRIPTSEEARAFLARNEGPIKRTAVVDALLESRECALHLASTFDIWLMERRSDTHVKSPEWNQFLVQAFTENKPYDALVREILAADGAESATRAAARFYLDRIGEPHVISRDVGRIFFGMDLQCAQCHDHPNVDDYLQRDYYGLLAFFNRTSLFHPDTKKPSALTERAEGESAYESVFTKVKGVALPRLPGGDAVPDPEPGETERYKVLPNDKDKNVRPVPTYSRREQLAQAVTAAGADQAFNRNIANRLWAHMMGHGLVEPFDFQHSANPPSHPELLDLLGREFAAAGYNIRWFLRQLALTNTYQRSFELPDALTNQATAAATRLRELESKVAEQTKKLREAKTTREEHRKVWHKNCRAYDKVAEPLTAAEKKRDEAAAAEKKEAEALSKLKEGLATKKKALDTLRQAATEAAKAAGLLPDDKELAEASAKIAARLDAIQKELAEGEKTTLANETTLVTAQKKVAGANQEVASAREIADAEKAKVLIVEAAFNSAHDAFRDAQSALKISERLRDDARALVEFAKLQDESARARTAARVVADQTAAQLKRSAEVEQHLLNLTLATNRTTAALGPGSSVDTELAEAANVLRSRRDASASEFRQQAELATVQLTRNDEAQALLRKAEEKADAARESLSARWTKSFAVGVFAPLMPEQLCMSTATATGQRQRTLAAGRAEFDKKLEEQATAAKKTEEAPTENAEQAEPKKEAEKPPPPPLKPEQRNSYVENYMRKQFDGSLKQYVRLFGGQQGQPQTDFYATADQALFLSNNGLVRGWLNPGGGNLTERLKQIDEPKDLAEELYLSVLTRLPAADETVRVADYLAARPQDRDKAIQELAWALLSSVEFRFRH